MNFSLFIVAILVFIIGIYLTSLEKKVKSDYIGSIGEKTTKKIIDDIDDCVYLLNNLYIPTIKGNTTEIDLVAFTNRGLLVVETKNYSGDIYGNVNDNEWFAAVHKKDNYFYNPIKQNATHIKFLSKEIGLKIPIYSIIVFSDRCSIDNIPDVFQDVYICQVSRLRETVNNILEENKPCISLFVLESVYNDLKKYSNPSEEVIKKHREYIENIKK